MPRLPEGPELTALDDGFREEPDAVYDRLRSLAPLHQDPAYARRFLTRHADVRHVLRDKAFGVDARQSLPGSYMRRVAATGVQEAQGDAAYEPPLVLLDDPAHRSLHMFNHIEYDSNSLAEEYFRDVDAGKPIAMPSNYFPDNDPARQPMNHWRSHAHLLFGNWINQLYQTAPFDVNRIGRG